jgi:hypothetical protein
VEVLGDHLDADEAEDQSDRRPQVDELQVFVFIYIYMGGRTGTTRGDDEAEFGCVDDAMRRAAAAAA